MNHEAQVDMTKMHELFESVRDTIDLMVQAADNEFPVMASTLVKANVANWKQLDIIEGMELIKYVIIDVPSILKPGSTVKEKAYYTERVIPRLVEEMGAKIIK